MYTVMYTFINMYLNWKMGIQKLAILYQI